MPWRHSRPKFDEIEATVEATESNLLHERAKVSGNYESKMDKHHSIAIGTQESFKVKLREELSQLGSAHDAKHRDQALKFKSSTEVLQVTTGGDQPCFKDNDEKHNQVHSLSQAGWRFSGSILREEISQVTREADAHYKEEQNLRKLGIENLNSKIREDILRANQDIITKLEKSWNVGWFFGEPRSENDQGVGDGDPARSASFKAADSKGPSTSPRAADNKEPSSDSVTDDTAREPRERGSP